MLTRPGSERGPERMRKLAGSPEGIAHGGVATGIVAIGGVSA